MAEPQSDRSRFTANIQGEIDSAALYRALSEAEANPQLAQIYVKLAAVEEEHAAFWARELEKAGHRVPSLRPSLRSRLLSFLARRFGPGMVLPTVNTLEQIDSGQYDKQTEAVAGGLPQAERSHARIINALAGGGNTVAEVGSLARLEGRHRGLGGNALRAAVLGANDGLVSNLSLVMGVAGAALSSHVVLMTGLAGLAAGACSMAMGEWLSVATARESYERQIAAEAEELAQVPEEEQEELALIYQAKGIPEDTARTMAAQLISNKESALDTLAREELGIDPAELGGSPWAAAGTSFGLFAAGAIFPILPYLFGFSGLAAVAGSLFVSGLALMGIGAATALFTGGSAFKLALRSLGFGFGAAALTFAIGKLIGVAVAG
ncbi:VIT1/CCC1 family predicted Fe2+/Mn2+ transporter [Rhizomicrobium palustre]|uniref:VIT1/CCC1 family predicted Fe2+/Mn2+ transporter n=1 Tax=Rhizomicrobium palustre TaxID=189966 RepID=A0A846MVM5_9PROT|nr:VIT1/CCC1 transporter family protein [Rhizomicrobium palustre]NIK87057.1 VIT1/CCC1 family predicted Fe2+/Mn2+ transporter [Rhizomicrobium palustre]